MEWLHYDFMRRALCAVICVAPFFALLGTMVVGKRMAFFSDVLGHSALTGVGLGVALGMVNPFWVMCVFMVLFAVAINAFRGLTRASADTVLGVFFAAAVALGIVILSKGGGFAKFTPYLIGDIVSVTREDIVLLLCIFTAVAFFWVRFGNDLVVMSISPVLARSRRVRVTAVETLFVVLLALVVAASIRIVGILVVNSMLILPAAAARVISGSMRAYTRMSILLSVVAGVAGLIISYYAGTAAGATIVLCGAGLYALSVCFAQINVHRSHE
jgi:zinc transport system permease protein